MKNLFKDIEPNNAAKYAQTYPKRLLIQLLRKRVKSI